MSLGPAWICILHSLQWVFITSNMPRRIRRLKRKPKLLFVLVFLKPVTNEQILKRTKTSIFGFVFVLAHKQAFSKVAVLPRMRCCYDDDDTRRDFWIPDWGISTLWEIRSFFLRNPFLKAENVAYYIYFKELWKPSHNVWFCLSRPCFITTTTFPFAWF